MLPLGDLLNVAHLSLIRSWGIVPSFYFDELPVMREDCHKESIKAVVSEPGHFQSEICYRDRASDNAYHKFRV